MTHLFLHPGLGKSGSTALQAYWNANSQVLAQHGFHYPFTGREPWDRLAMRRDAHHLLSAAMRGKIPRLEFADFSPLLEREAARCHQPNLLISSESISARVARPLLDLFPEVTVLLVVRHPQEMRYSDYLERVKSNLYTGTFNEFVLDYRRNQRFSDGVGDWQKVCATRGFHFRAITYSRDRLFSDVMTVLDMPPPDSKDIPFVNERMPSTVYEFKRVTNRDADHLTGGAISRFLEAHAPRLQLMSTVRPLDASLKPEARDLIEGEITFFNERLGTDFQWTDPPTFDHEAATANKEELFLRLATISRKTVPNGPIDDRISALVRAVFTRV
jgi:hypothetical protein